MATKWINQTELSDQIGVPVRTIEDWRRRKYGPPWTPFGRAVRYSQTAVDKWAAAKEQGSAAA